MSVLQQALENGKFGVTAEMAPPKGCDFTEQMEAAELLKGKVHAINVTDMQSACLKKHAICAATAFWARPAVSAPSLTAQSLW